MNHVTVHKIYDALKGISAIRMKDFLTTALESPYGFGLDQIPEDALVRLAAVCDITPNTRSNYYPNPEMAKAFDMLLDNIKKMTQKAFLAGNSIDDPDSWGYIALSFDPVHAGPEVKRLFEDALNTNVTRYSDGALSVCLNESEVVHTIPLLKKIMGATEVEIVREGESEYDLDFTVSGFGYNMHYNLVYNQYGNRAVKNGKEHVNNLWWLNELELEPEYELIDYGNGIYRVQKYGEEVVDD